MDKKGEFAGKTALITGAAQGIGKSVARAFLYRGANVVLSDINVDAVRSAGIELTAISGEVVSVAADVTNLEQVRRMVDAVTARYGAIDILMNNAGVLRPTAIEKISEEEWDLVMDVNVKGTFLCTQTVLPIMRERCYGRIVNVSSSAGRSTSTLGGAHYTTAKAAVLGFSRHCAKEYARYGITVNAVCPGLIDTEMVQENVSPERLQAYIDSFPIERLGRPEEVADLILFLASDKAAYITGATFDINGGDLMI